ncbi:MAG: metal ABC transporter substrate-binding protein [Clostridia bacterium]|nr:metal ABC transporter substrate-binding protein [Clostridia bacterium]
MLKKNLCCILSALSICTSLCACANTTQKSNSDTQTVKVSVTFNAMQEFAKAVGGDKVEVSAIIPDGMEPHDFEPKAQDIMALSNADVFVYNGLGMENWVQEALDAANNADLIVIQASSGIDPIANTESREMDEHGRYDPHVWLSIKGAQIEAANIKDALIKADPKNKDFYEKNCSDFISQLENLYNEYSLKIQSLKRKNLVTGHAAFAYLCRDFGLEQNSVEDVFAEGEPSAQQLGELVKYCRDNHVTTVFAEEMASPEISQTLADEIGARVETIYTIESNEDDKTYLQRMEENISKIYDSML